MNNVVDDPYVRLSKGVGDAIKEGFDVGMDIFRNMQRLIMLSDGEFYCNRVRIDFPDKKMLYVKFVYALFEIADKDGFCAYRLINASLEANGVEQERDEKEQIKRISNAIAQLYRNRTKQMTSFPKFTDGGREVISINRGRGITFHNPITG